MAYAAPARTFVGSAKCASCHPDEFRRQSASPHARALSLAAQHPLATQFPIVTELRRGAEYRFQLNLQPDRLAVTVYDSRNSLEIPVQWAFGAGGQAVTLVSRIDRNWYLEHYLTYYTRLRAMGPTPGHQDRAPGSLPEAAGFVYKSRDPAAGIVQCFACHSTGPVDSSHAAIEPAEPGVHCEACHGPGSLHAQTADPKLISNPGRLRAAELNVFCGRCHRPPESADGPIDWNYAWNVRHQPSHLGQSACFRKSKGALSCLSCHRPHDSAPRGQADYNGVCASCHSAAHAETERRQGNCVDCHMPLVSPQPPLRFTNHWIGVYGSGSKLTPTARRAGQ